MTPHPFLDGPHPRAFAHRGWHIGGLNGMENSLSALQRAFDEGYRYLETDVHATRDGVLVLQHDPTLDRTTDTSGRIAELAWTRVRAARIAGREPPCRLEEVLEELPEARLNVDVKADGAVEPVLTLLARTDAWHRVCLASFSDARLRALRRAAGPRLLTSMGMASARALRLRSLAPWHPARLGLRGGLAQVPRRRGRWRIVDGGLVRYAQRWGTEVHVWTIDDPDEMHELLDLGVDGLMTDRPDLLRAVLAARGQWNRR